VHYDFFFCKESLSKCLDLVVEKNIGYFVPYIARSYFIAQISLHSRHDATRPAALSRFFYKDDSQFGGRFRVRSPASGARFPLRWRILIPERDPSDETKLRRHLWAVETCAGKSK